MSPLEEQSEAIFSQLLEHGSNGAELTRNSDLRSTEVESVTLEAQRRWNTRRVKVLSCFIYDGGTLVAPILQSQVNPEEEIGGTLDSVIIV